MKKLSLILLAVLTASTLTAATGSVETKFQSEYVFRGTQEASNVVVANARLDWQNFYGNVNSVFNLQSQDVDVSHKVIGTAGYLFSTDLVPVNFDVGVNGYWYPENDKKFLETEYTVEPFVGLSVDLPLNPSAYVLYDIQTEALTVEARLSQDLNFAGYEKFSAKVSALYGYTDSRDKLPELAQAVRDGYGYWGVELATQYQLTSSVRSFAAVTYAENRNTESKNDWVYWSAGLNYSW